MDSTNALVRMADQPALVRVARPLSEAIRGACSRAGDAGQVAKNALHGGPLPDGTLKARA